MILPGEEGAPAQESLVKSRYYRLVADAVEGLEDNTVDTRRVLYERARSVLSARAAHYNPPFASAEIERERLALEEAVRLVEAEAPGRRHISPPSALGLHH